jgi:hypothetical protein
LGSASAGSIFVDLLLRDAQYREGLKRSKDATSDFAKGVKDLAKELAPVLGVAGFAAIADKALTAADAIQKASQTVGLSVEGFQKFSYALKLGGIDQETFTTALIKLNNNIAAGTVPYASTQSALLGISDKLKGAKDSIEQTRIASEAFGAKLGARLIPALSQGSAGLIDLGREAQNLGLVFSSKLTKDAEAFKDQIEILGQVFTKNFQAGLLEGFVGDSKKIKDLYSDPKFLESVRALGDAFGAVAAAALQLAKVPAYLRAIFIELPSAGGRGIGNFINTGSFKDPNPNVSTTRPKTVDTVTHDSAAIDAALAQRGLQTNAELLERQKELQDDINKAAAEHAKIVGDATKSISDQTELLAIENDHWGENKNAVEAIVGLRKIELDLAEKGVTLSETDKDNIKQKLDALATEKNLQQELKDADQNRADAQKALLDSQEEQRKHLEDSITRVKEDLASNITDVIKGAKSLGDAFKDVAEHIAEAVTQAQILKLLSSVGIGGSGSGGSGGGGGFLSSIFGGDGPFGDLFSSFDVGTNFVPKDQLANIHQGEMIIPRVTADKIRANGVGTNVTMNVYAQDASSFARSQNQILQQTQMLLSKAQKRNG